MLTQRLSVFLLILGLSIPSLTAQEISTQEIIDRAIENSGGQAYETHKVSFDFRGKNYVSYIEDGNRTYERSSKEKGGAIRDIKTDASFKRVVNGAEVKLSPKKATSYANSVNSVHYFARLPYGLNEAAVQKELLGKVTVNQKPYYKIKVTFETAGGGSDHEDTYLYWVSADTFNVDFLAYEFHIDGGGIRFREAYNERFVEGVRFVDYNNYKPKSKGVDFFTVDALFEKGELKLLSKIELENMSVSKMN